MRSHARPWFVFEPDQQELVYAQGTPAIVDAMLKWETAPTHPAEWGGHRAVWVDVSCEVQAIVDLANRAFWGAQQYWWSSAHVEALKRR